jgi:hypothetical protein
VIRTVRKTARIRATTKVLLSPTARSHLAAARRSLTNLSPKIPTLSHSLPNLMIRKMKLARATEAGHADRVAVKPMR